MKYWNDNQIKDLGSIFKNRDPTYIFYKMLQIDGDGMDWRRAAHAAGVSTHTLTRIETSQLRCRTRAKDSTDSRPVYIKH